MVIIVEFCCMGDAVPARPPGSSCKFLQFLRNPGLPCLNALPKMQSRPETFQKQGVAVQDKNVLHFIDQFKNEWHQKGLNITFNRPLKEMKSLEEYDFRIWKVIWSYKWSEEQQKEALDAIRLLAPKVFWLMGHFSIRNRGEGLW